MEIRGAKSINGSIEVPGDKSISHRSAIISSISNSRVEITNFLNADDCLNTLKVLEKLGVKTSRKGTKVIIHGKNIEQLKEPSTVLDVGNSGTTIRIMAGLLSTTNFLSVLTGDSSINNRPMDRIIKPLSEMGAEIYGRENNRKAPLVILGKENLAGKKLYINVSSAQVKSCLTLAALSARGVTEIIQPHISRDHTERMLQYFGANIEYDGKFTKIIPGGKLSGKDIYVPRDISSAIFFIVSSLILKDSHVVLKDVGINKTRSFILGILKKMGANIEIKNIRQMNNEKIADIESYSSNLKAIKVTGDIVPNIIDEIPILCVAAARAKGLTRIRGAKELRYKESDRIRGIYTQFKKLGIKIEENEDGLDIYGEYNLEMKGATLDSFGDHRMAMSLAVIGLLNKEKVNILNSDCIRTSFPDFFKQLERYLSYG
ncbi:MAG: 3-phosphoshikimate 1-carboxyvinyltransferase [Actinomycetota bacterium]